jgi:hypothetical protein
VGIDRRSSTGLKYLKRAREPKAVPNRWIIATAGTIGLAAWAQLRDHATTRASRHRIEGERRELSSHAGRLPNAKRSLC